MRLPRRFDDALMSPPDAGAAVDPAVLSRVRSWSEDLDASGRAPWLRVACIASSAGLDGAACVLDGSHELARLGRLRGTWWRLRILVRECLWPARAWGRPWDCGWWRAGATGPARAFRPRRATLLMVRESDAAGVAPLLAALEEGHPSFEQPLRVLVITALPLDGVARL